MTMNAFTRHIARKRNKTNRNLRVKNPFLKDGEWGYSFYLDKNGNPPRQFAKHQTLPLVRLQGPYGHCYFHAGTMTSECITRIDRGRRGLRTPELSIQNGIDACKANNDSLFPFLFYRGVAAQRKYPFRGPVRANYCKKKWVHYKMDGIHVGLCDYKDFSVEEVVGYLARLLHDMGPFMGGYKSRVVNKDNVKWTRSGKLVLTNKGRPQLDEETKEELSHVVVVFGLKWWRTKRTKKFKGYWKCLSSPEANHDRGVIRIEFGALLAAYFPIAPSDKDEGNSVNEVVPKKAENHGKKRLRGDALT